MEPGDGLEWKKEKDQDGNDIDTQILQVKIDSTEADSPKPGKWPVNLSVSPEGLKGELDLTVDTSVHDLGGGASVGLSNATAGVLTSFGSSDIIGLAPHASSTFATSFTVT